MRLLRVVRRGAGLTLHIAGGALVAAFSRGGLPPAFARGWCRLACALVGLRVRVRGTPTLGPALFAANHVSWLEVLALGAAAPLDFVAKSEVARWPGIGRLASSGGTLFLRRGSARAAERTMREVLERLASGRSVAAFPEGTSTDGTAVLAFKPALFEAAARLGCEVQPVAVSYPTPRGPSRIAPFIGDDEFLPHLLRVLAEPETPVELAFAPALSGHNRTREELAFDAREAILSALGADQSRSGERSLVAP